MSSSEDPCPACKWTPDQQRRCSYESSVRLFYGASSRGYWSLGSKFLLKEREKDPPSYEVINTHFIKENTTIPVHTTIQEWTEGEKYFQIVERVPGVPLEEIWSSIPQPDREKLARQTTEYLGQLRSFHSAKMESVHGQPISCAHLFRGDYGAKHGPLSTADELWDVLAKSLSDKVPEVVRSRLRDSMPSPHPWTFTHGDLTSCNIIVDPTSFELRALIDWEGSGYFPVWWEFTAAGFGFGDEDLEWKRLLLGNLANHKEARTWFLEFKSFASRSKDSETRLKVLKECGIEEDIDI
ncbi:Aminoglycoside phosphotransferase [Penicillium coprophilum]|uniref:Aminoglycoside phosphotransferase n=1 Tax=Penicillium coprophilum TaxID=36646 RepID=UPI00239B9E2A|nr:Aminoglycoside phosphotransferase [Penicillium coprophilum]KAJ5170086.1 Aminoglycoside phosphotransferase [Penicillium coprophilum]